MNCNECLEEIYSLPLGAVDSITHSALLHINSCEKCRNSYSEYQNIVRTLSPSFPIKAPSGIKENVLAMIHEEEAKSSRPAFRILSIHRRRSKWLAAAAMIGILLLVIPFLGRKDELSGNAKAAETIFMSAIYATDSIQTMIMHFRIRTDEKDNFDVIGANFGMVEHQLIHSVNDPQKWILEKGGRKVLFDGINQYLWVPSMDLAIKGSADADFIGWLRLLLDPSSIYWKEEQKAEIKGDSITIRKKGDEINLTLVSKAEGNFINDYMKDKTISSSTNRREYVFDNKTHLLKGLKIYLLQAHSETLIFELEDITYNPPINNSVFQIPLPNGIDWYSPAEDNLGNSLTQPDAKSAAKAALDGLSRSDINGKTALWSLFNPLSRKLIVHFYGGLRVIKIGQPFRSGTYPGEFVPYTIQLPGGEIKKSNLAVRNDNSNKVWMVDGGL